MMLEELKKHQTTSFWQNQRYVILITGVISISILLVTLSMWLYNTSGTAQLDLSRPGYQSVREQAEGGEEYKGFDAMGPLDHAALEEFKKLYSERASRVKSIDAFGSDALSDEALFGPANNSPSEQ